MGTFKHYSLVAMLFIVISTYHVPGTVLLGLYSSLNLIFDLICEVTLDEEGKARKTVIESYLLKKKKDIMANKLHVCKC